MLILHECKQNRCRHLNYVYDATFPVEDAWLEQTVPSFSLLSWLACMQSEFVSKGEAKGQVIDHCK